MSARPSLRWQDGSLLCRAGDRLSVLPAAAVLQVVIRPDAGGYALVAQHGDQQTTLAVLYSYRQARRLLARAALGRPAARVLSAAAGIVVALPVVLFVGWFLFVLPSAPHAAAGLFAPGVDTAALTTPARRAVDRRPAKVADPAAVVRPEAPAAATPAGASPVGADPSATAPSPASAGSAAPPTDHPFGLGR